MKINHTNEIDDQLSIISTIEKSPLSEISKDVLEFSFDQLLKDGSFREFPVVGTILNIGKLGLCIRDAMFLKKVFRFLYHLKDIPKDKRESFAKMIREDSDYRKRGSDNLLLIIDKINHFEKADMLGRIYCAHLEELIDMNTLEKLVSSVEKVNVHDLLFLKEISLLSKIMVWDSRNAG